MKRFLFFMRSGRFLNYARQRLRVLTLKRLANVLRIEWDYLRKHSIVRAYPYEIIIDTSNICQLRCPLCSTGSGRSRRQKGYMSLDVYKRIIDEFAPFAMHVYLHNWGEPLLHKDIISFIRYAKDRRMAVSLSSNLNVSMTDASVDELLRSGLDTLILSIDGASKETYEHYRVGGDFDRVMTNVRRLAARKRALGLKRPYLEWQFLRMRHNESEMGRAQELASEIGVDNIAFGSVLLPFGETDRTTAEQWLPPEDLPQRKRFDLLDRDLEGACWWLWRTVVFNWDGSVSPCCYVDERSAEYGTVVTSPFMAIWNGAEYIAARELFGGKKTGLPIICSKCGLTTRL